MTSAGDIELRAVTRFHDLGTPLEPGWLQRECPVRTLQELRGIRDFKTTLIYADYAPGTNEASLVNAAFARRKPR